MDQTDQISEFSPISGLSGSNRHALDRVGNRLAVTETLLTLAEVSVGTYLESGGQVVMEAEHFSERSGSAEHDWLLKTSQSGYTGTSYLQALPDLDIPLVGSTGALTANATAAYPSNSPPFDSPATNMSMIRLGTDYGWQGGTVGIMVESHSTFNDSA